MAVPVYSTDLIDITLSESITNWVALGGGASGLGIGADFSMQGTNCVDKAVTASEKGQIFNNGSSILLNGQHVFVWAYLATAGLANTLANRGLAIILGASTTAYVAFHVEGSDTYGAVGRVGKCYPISYVSTGIASVPYRTTTGIPNNNVQYFGATTNITGTVKGANLGVDAIRRGTGVFITAGDVTTPANFTGMASTNDSVSNRWGILTFIAGNTFELQGILAIGRDAAGTATQAYFSGNNQSILIVDTPHSTTNFTQIVVDHASTICNLTNCVFTAVGTNNQGLLVYNNASTVSAITGCSFSGFGTSVLRAGVTSTGCSWRNCGDITQNSATITTATLANTRIVSNNPGLISNCTVTGDGTKHGIELTTAGTYSFNGMAFSGFGTTGSTSAAIYNNSGGAITLNIGGGGTTPTIRNGTGASTSLVIAPVTLTFTGIVNGSEVRIYSRDGSGNSLTELDGIETVSTGSFNYVYTYAASTYVNVVIFNTAYQYYAINGLLLGNTSSSIPVQQISDRQYFNPA